MFAYALLFIAALTSLIFLFVGISKVSKSAPIKSTFGKPFKTGTGLDILTSSSDES